MNEKERKQHIINLALEEYLNTPEEERSLTKLGEKYGVKRQTLSKHLKDKGFEVINYQNRLRCDETVFDKIDNEEAAYWLGFLYADGNISSTGNRLEVRLSIKDLFHLEKFRKFLKLSTEIRTGIYNGNGFCHLSIRNKHLWETLDKLGCHPRKSLILKFPKLNIFKGNIKELVLHFIRGYVDGDGCLSIYKRNTGVIATELNIVGTESFLKTINHIFKDRGYISNKSCNNWDNKAFQLKFSFIPSRKIARYLYENANIYLERKYKKYLEFCSLEDESLLRKSSKIGESCDGNTEVNSEIAKGSESL